MCVKEREKHRVGERESAFSTSVSMYEREKSERDDERLGLNHISKFGMSSDQRTAMLGERKGRRLYSPLLPYLSLLSFSLL